MKTPIDARLAAPVFKAGHRPRRSAPRGYTYVELMVVTCIIGVLVALLLPAVQAAREAARRCECGKNIEQLIIAVQQYESLHAVYPAGVTNDTSPIRSRLEGEHHNWIARILPHLEQTRVFAEIDWSQSVYADVNLPARALEFSVLRCGSGQRGRGAYSDYAANHHHVEAAIDADNQGMFFLNTFPRHQDIKDGASTTLFLGEKLTLAGDLGWMSGTRATLRNTGVPINVSGWSIGAFPYARNVPPGLDGDSDQPIPDGKVLDVLFRDYDGASLAADAFSSDEDEFFGGGDYASGYLGDAGGGVAIKPPFRHAWTFQRPTDAELAVGGFGSEHPGGAQFALGDGQVRFLSEGIDPRVLVQMGHRSDGELTSDNYR